MKLSDLIDYKITVDSLTFDDITELFNDKVRQMLIDIENNGKRPKVDEEINNLKSSVKILLESVKDIDHDLNQIKSKVKGYRSRLEKEALLISHDLYKMGRYRESRLSYILERYYEYNILLDKESTEYYAKRIQLYSSWQHPGAIVRPLDGSFVGNMLANDPLYILDEGDVLLKPTKSLFTTAYQSRLRYKVFNENTKPYLLNSLPNGQIGLLLMNEFLNIRSFEIIKEYLSEIYKILKPGGVSIITFNNCDIPQCTRNFESGASCYTPASLLIPLVESYNFEILKQVDTPINFSWLEIKKPGKLTSLRGGQALTEIK